MIMYLHSLFFTLAFLFPPMQLAIPYYFDSFNLLQKAKKEIPNSGILRQTKEGYVYLEVSDKFIDELLPLLPNKKIKNPPYFESGGIGTHISVILIDEMPKNSGITIEEIGEKIPFKVLSLATVESQKIKEVDKFYYLSIDCPRIEKIREKYGFPKKILDYDFHITIGWEFKKGFSQSSGFSSSPFNSSSKSSLEKDRTSASSS